MGAKKAYARYRQATVETASPGKLVVMLYDGAIKFAGEAIDHIEAGRPKEAHFSIVRAEEIIGELMASLDMEQGGQIAKNLLALYEFMYVRLVEANIHKDRQRIDEVISLLTDLREAWAQAVEIHAREQFHARQDKLTVSEDAAAASATGEPPRPPTRAYDTGSVGAKGGFSIVR